MICPHCHNETLTMGRCNICGYLVGQNQPHGFIVNGPPQITLPNIDDKSCARRLLDQVELSPREAFTKKTQSQKFKRIQVVLPPNVLKKLNLLASDKKHSRSSHIERAVRFYLTVLGFDLDK